MNRFISTITLIMILLGFGLSGCAARTPGASTAPSDTSTQTPVPTTAGPTVQASAQASSTAGEKTFTAADLAKYDGKNGTPAYIAVNGTVYDVTNAPKWSNGKHEGYQAGKDLTKEIQQAPHGVSVLGQLPVVGKYTGK